MAIDNKLKKVNDEYAILSMLFEAKDNNVEVFIWKFIGNKKYLAPVRIESIRKRRNDFCLIPAEGQEHLVEDIMGSHTTIDLYIPESAILLRCKVKQKDAPARYYLQLPDFVAQVDRRKRFRLNVHEESKVKVTFSLTISKPQPIKQHFIKECYDMSAGGFSFYISKMESKLFQMNAAISNLEIKIENWATKASAEIASIREIEPDENNGLSYKVLRVSCRFTQIDLVSQKYLEKFIFERIKDELHVINE